MTPLQEMVHHVIGTARKLVEGRIFIPHAIVFDPEWQADVKLLHNATREQMIAISREAINRTDAQACLVVHECWIASSYDGDPCTLPPSKRDDRIDALMVYGETRGGHTAIATLGVREKDGEVQTYDLGDRGMPTDVVSTWNLFNRTEQ